MTSFKKMIIVLLIVLVILLMFFGAVWSAEIKNPSGKGLFNDSMLNKRLKGNKTFIRYPGHNNLSAKAI
jgi:hypothetical protein